MFNMDSRFMVETATYSQMHPPGDGQWHRANRDELGSDVVSQDDPDLGDEFFLCLFLELTGYDVQNKEWCKCQQS
jgi:hypothetical protein